MQCFFPKGSPYRGRDLSGSVVFASNCDVPSPASNCFSSPCCRFPMLIVSHADVQKPLDVAALSKSDGLSLGLELQLAAGGMSDDNLIFGNIVHNSSVSHSIMLDCSWPLVQ